MDMELHAFEEMMSLVSYVVVVGTVGLWLLSNRWVDP